MVNCLLWELITDNNFTVVNDEGDNSFGTKSSTAGSAATLYQKLSGTGLEDVNATLQRQNVHSITVWFCRNPGLIF